MPARELKVSWPLHRELVYQNVNISDLDKHQVKFVLFLADQRKYTQSSLLSSK